MSLFKQGYERALHELDRILSDSLTYYPPEAAGESSVAITGSVGSIRTEEFATLDGIGMRETRALTLVVDADHPRYCGIATVEPRGLFLVDGELWAVDEVERSAPYKLRLRLVRSGQRSLSGRGGNYRGGNR